MRAIMLVILVASLAGCNQYQLVKQEPIRMSSGMTVASERSWSRLAAGSREIWTVDGVLLESITFFDGVGDGEQLFDGNPEQTFPKFAPRMTASEVQELYTDSLTILGGSRVEARGLRPYTLGDTDGFRFDLTYINADGLDMRGMVVGAVRGTELFLIVYSGARSHYFDRYKNDVEQLLRTVNFPTT
ncbi:MAG: hypothetical protein AAF417_16750 [Pseudomonadota bacterium]